MTPRGQPHGVKPVFLSTFNSGFTLTDLSLGNAGPIYIAKDPWYGGVAAVFDDICLYDCALPETEIATLATPPEIEPPTPSPDPVAWWKLDETTGTAAADAGPGACTGALHNTSAWVWSDGPREGAVVFDGQDDYLEIPAAVTVTAMGADDADFTLAFWLRLDQGATGNWRNIVHGGATDYQRTGAMWLRPGDNRINYAMSTTANWSEYSTTTAELVLGAWTHLAYVKDGHTVKFYINGQLDSGGTLAGLSLGNTGPLRFGKAPWYPAIAGGYDDIRIYERAITATEAAALAVVTTPPPGLHVFARLQAPLISVIVTVIPARAGEPFESISCSPSASRRPRQIRFWIEWPLCTSHTLVARCT